MAVSKRTGQPTSFLDLPPELRNKIYHLILPTGYTIEMKVSSGLRTESGLEAMDGEIGREASAIVFGNNTFRPKSVEAAFAFLDSVGPDRRHMIARLELLFCAARGKKRRASLQMVLSAVRGLCRGSIAGLRADAVFVAIDDAGDWVRLTEVSEFVIVEDEGRWQVSAKDGTPFV